MNDFHVQEPSMACDFLSEGVVLPGWTSPHRSEGKLEGFYTVLQRLGGFELDGMLGMLFFVSSVV